MNSFNYLSGRDTFTRIRAHTAQLFKTAAHEVTPATWQGIDVSKKPEAKYWELMNYTFTHQLSGQDLDFYRQDVKPNLPWADNHFAERVCGAPINPGVEWANWPWGGSADKFRNHDGKFNHNYMERYWPKYAGSVGPTKTVEEFKPPTFGDPNDPYNRWPMMGIRNLYGDLNDLVQSLFTNPTSRQEWFPIFHPEDVGEVIGGRKPCSLGYQFWVRGAQLHVYYPMRSCDFAHHMQDDIYLTIRLLLWVLNECRKREVDPAYWHEVTPGTLTMHVTSLHVFANDMIQLNQGKF
jgi:hypothetical protein